MRGVTWRLTIGRTILLATIALTMAAPRARATTYYVDWARTDDLGDGLSWDMAKKTIQAGIDAAGAGEGGQVWVKRGLYNEARTSPDGSVVMQSGVALYGGFADNETSLSQRNLPANETIIDGSTARGGSAAYHVVKMSGVADARLDGFTIKGGNANSGSVPDYHGGGIYCTSSNDTNAIANCEIGGNSANNIGGGILCWFASPSITSCVIAGNSAGSSGGGLVCDASTPSIANCAIGGNSASTYGGGVYCYAASPSIANCAIGGNSAQDGGGINCGNGGALSVTNSIISGNAAQRGSGMLCYSASPTITNSTFSENVVGSNYGSAIYCMSSSSPQIKNTIFERNVGSFAIYEDAANCAPVVSYSLFYSNPTGDYWDAQTGAQNGGAAINALGGGNTNNIGPSDPKFLMNGTAGTTGTWTAAPSYSGATNQTTLTNGAAGLTPGRLKGRLVNPNTAQTRQALIADNTTTQALVWGDVTGYVTSGSAYRVIDYHLILRSEAIDTGTSVSAPGTDIEGNVRPVEIPGHGTSVAEDSYDIGAYEAQLAALAPSPAPDNPGATGIELAAITWTWNDRSVDQDGYKVWSGMGSTAPTGAPTATTAKNASSFTTSGLAANTQYAFQAAATNIAGDSAKTPNYAAWTLVEAVSGLSFSSVTTGSISVASANTPSNLAAGSSGLYFANTTAATSNAWQQSNTPWVSGSLSPNTQYAFSGKSRNGAGEETTAASGAKYTLAAVPVAPNVTSPTVNTLDVAIGSGDGNPAETEYAIAVSPAVGGNTWVQGDGTVRTNTVYLTATAWGTQTVSGLTESQTYTFRVRARNADGIETSDGPGADGTTQTPLPGQPTDPGATSITVSQINWTWKDNSTNESSFNIYTGPGATAPGTITTTVGPNVQSWLQTGLTTNTQYAVQVSANNDGGESSKTANLSRATLAAKPVAPVVGDPTSSTLNVAIGAGDGNPAWTLYAIRISPAIGGHEWVQTTGTVGANPAFQTRAAWGTKTVGGLAKNTAYTFAATARNGDNVDTAEGPSASGATAIGGSAGSSVHGWRLYE